MSAEAQAQANALLLSAAGDTFAALADAVTKGLFSVVKILGALGGAAGMSEHASKLRFAEAYAAKKGISVDAAFMELDQGGFFDDRFY